MGSTRVAGHVNAPRAAVYRALIDAEAIAAWRVPAGMRSEVHEFEAREGGAFRVSLHYDSPDAVGKTSAHTDTYHGRFVELVPNERVVEVLEFESDDPAMAGEMTMTTTLRDLDAGTEVVIQHDEIPDAVNLADNETGTRMALAALAAWMENRG
ncbi:polyketide cyclase [Mycobacterium sp. 20091114027_K0903767]|nr:polyketide cyclase [Mycobacterium sp. 20091114027_K0903767]